MASTANQVAIEDIKIGDNVRTDYGDIDGLAASIKANGIMTPVVISTTKELIDGHRRLKAAAIAGLKEVPTVIQGSSTKDKRVDQIIYGIFSKPLSPIEEAQAYGDYLKETGGKKDAAIEALGKKIVKTPAYIKRRLQLNNTSAEVQEALNKKQIEVGHAELLAQMDEKQQKVALAEIIENDFTVQNFADNIRWLKNKIDFGDLQFRPRNVEKKQTLLSDVCKELYPVNNANGTFTESAAFKKDLAAYVEAQREELRAKGITVYANKEILLKDWPKAQEIQSYDSNYAKVLKTLATAKSAAVVVDLNSWGSLSKDVYILEPVIVTPKEEKTVEKKPTKKEIEAAEEALELSREQKLNKRVNEYKVEVHRNELALNLKAGSHEALAFDVHVLANKDWQSKTPKSMKTLLAKTDKELKEYQATELKRQHIETLGQEDLEALSFATGTTYEKAFKMTEDFASMFTKPQLIELAGEAKILPAGGDWETSNLKTGEIVSLITKEWPSGQVPKILQRKSKKVE